MERFYITVSDIHTIFHDKSKSTAQKNFANCKKYCEEKGIPLLDKESVPTKAFCDFKKLDMKLFVEVLKEKKKEKENEK